MWKKAILLTILISSYKVSSAYATPIFTDSFDTIDNVDMQKTNAYVDTIDGWLELERGLKANVVTSDGDNNTGIPSNIVVADKSGGRWYVYDESTGKMVENTALSLNYTNPLGVSLVPQSFTSFVLVSNGTGYDVRQAVFDGNGMVDNPIMAVSGLTGIVSISAMDSTTVATADKDGKVSVYTLDDSKGTVAKDTVRSFDTGLTNIKAVKNIQGTMNFLVITSTGSYTYMYDTATNGYVKNASMTIDTKSGMVVAGDTSSDGNLVDLLSPPATSAYSFDQATGGMSVNTVYSIGGLTDVVAVSMPTTNSVVIASQDGKIKTYQYDESKNTYVENTSLEIQGISFSGKYLTTSTYVSKPITPASPNNVFKLSATEQNDTNTSISYELSVDSGTTFTSIPLGKLTHLPANSATIPTGPYIIKATLTSPSADITPRLLDVTLDASLDDKPPIITITDPDPNWVYQPIPVTITITDPDPSAGMKLMEYAITKDVNVPTSWTPLTNQTETVTVDQDGQWYVHVHAVDNADNEAFAYKGPFKLDITPPVANFDWTPNPPLEGDTVTLINKSKEVNNEQMSHVWTVISPSGNVTTTNIALGQPADTQIINAEAGDYLIKLTSTDEHGASDAGSTITKTMTVIALSVKGKVYHAPDWDAYMTANYPSRPKDHFWSGERFMLGATTTDVTARGYTTAVQVTMQETGDLSDLTSVSPYTDWKGEMWKDTYVTFPNNTVPYTFIFTAYFMNGGTVVKTSIDKVVIYLDGSINDQIKTQSVQ